MILRSIHYLYTYTPNCLINSQGIWTDRCYEAYGLARYDLSDIDGDGMISYYTLLKVIVYFSTNRLQIYI
jgi:hypothetical protein